MNDYHISTSVSTKSILSSLSLEQSSKLYKELSKRNEEYEKAKKLAEETQRHVINTWLRKQIKKVKYDSENTVVWFDDGDICHVKRQSSDRYDKEKALLECIAKHFYENNSRVFHEQIKALTSDDDPRVQVGK